MDLVSTCQGKGVPSVWYEHCHYEWHDEGEAIGREKAVATRLTQRIVDRRARLPIDRSVPLQQGIKDKRKKERTERSETEGRRWSKERLSNEEGAHGGKRRYTPNQRDQVMSNVQAMSIPITLPAARHNLAFIHPGSTADRRAKHRSMPRSNRRSRCVST